MEERISAAEANRTFSHLLRRAREGQSFVVTSHGRPVARLSPLSGERAGMRADSIARLLDRLGRQSVIDIGRWTRDELYDDRS